ncbi:MAG TPA: iron-containing redox enzyme family protein [Streptosporangiaceae bacterium]|nr:iron-containing redox enzyme family protein [Streptosporangiaceae bacterium]
MSVIPDHYAVDNLHGLVNDLVNCDDVGSLNARAGDDRYRQAVADAARTLASQAFTDHDEDAARRAHATLAVLYDWYFSPPSVDGSESLLQVIADDIRRVLENVMLDDIYGRMDLSSLSGVPEDHESFLPWYRHFISIHQASNHSFYRDFLENRATPEDFRFYLAQETVLDPRFDDILAMLIVGTVGPEKMELGGNLWDELGNGDPADVHPTVFAQTLRDAGVQQDFVSGNIMAESIASGNVSAALALSKRHYYKAIGYFGVTEYLTPRRFRSFVLGCKRLGLPEAAYRYHDMHIQVDARHGPSWFKNIVLPAIAREPRSARDIAFGTLIRMETSTWFLNAIQRVLDV